MIDCRCRVINVMTGDAATDYARQHLDRTREDSTGKAWYRCPDTGQSWIVESGRGLRGDDLVRLRRDRV